MIAIIAMIFFQSVKSTLLPVAAADIGGTEYYTVASTIPSIVGIICMPLFGFLCTRNPALKIKLFYFGLGLSALGITLSGLVNSIVLMTVTQLSVPMSGAAIYVCGYSLISDMYDREKAGIYIGFCGSCLAVGQLVAPLVGGMIIEQLSWRALFIICGVITFIPPILMIAGVKLTSEQAASMAVKGVQFDTMGSVGLVMLLAGTVLCLSFGNSLIPFGSLPNYLCMVLAVAGMIILVMDIKQKGNAAIIPAPALRDKNTCCFAVANVFNNFAGMTVFFFMPTYILYVLNGSPTQASLANTCFGILGVVLSAMFGRMIGKAGTARTVGVMGNVVRVIVVMAMAFVLNPSTSLLLVYALMFVGGIFNSSMSVTFSAGPQVQLRPEIRVAGNSVIQTMQNIGSMMGTVVCTMLMGIFGVADGFKIGLYVAAVMGVVTMVCLLPLKTLEQQGVTNS